MTIGVYTSIVTRSFFVALLSAMLLAQEPGQEQKKAAPAKSHTEQEPPEEDESLSKPAKEYTFNPLQAESELKTGNFYFKKKSYKAAAKRFEEATRWNPSSAEAFLRLGEALEKNGNRSASIKAFSKYLELAPDAKNTDEIRKKVQK